MAGRGEEVEELDADLDTDLDADLRAVPAPAQRRAPRPGRWRRRWRVLAAVVVAVLVVTGALLRQSQAREGERPAVDPGAPVGELFPLLGAEGSAADAGPYYPAVQAEAGLGADPTTARLLAAAGGLLFWAAQDDEGRVCLVVRTSELPLRLGGHCAPVREAATRGVALPEGQGVAATLVPEGFDTGPLRAQGWVVLADGLWVGPETAADLLQEVVGAVAARPVVPPQATTGDGSLPVFLTREFATYAVVLVCLSPDDGTDDGTGAGGEGVDLAVDGVASLEDCSALPVFRRFTGDGGPGRVDVGVPDGAVWAARVVECEGSLRGPVCDRR